MLKIIFLLLFIVPLFSCSADKWNKDSPALFYQIISTGNGEHVQQGETIKMQVKQMYRDSLLSTTWDKIPAYQRFDSLSMTPDALRIFAQARKGDSIIFKHLSDSAFSHKWPPFARKGEWLYTHIKVIDVLGVAHDVESDREMEINKHPPLER